MFFGKKNPRTESLKVIFEESFKTAPDVITDAAQTAAPEGGRFYSPLKNVTHIKIPNIVGAIIGNPVIKAALTIAVCVKTIFVGREAYVLASHLLVARIIPFSINNTPTIVFKIGNCALDALDYARKNLLFILGGTYLLQQLLHRIPRIPYFTRAVQSISVENLFSLATSTPESLGVFLLNTALIPGKFTWNGCGMIANYCNSIAAAAETAKLRTCQDKAFAVWTAGLTHST